MNSTIRIASQFKYCVVLCIVLASLMIIGCSRDPEQRTAYKGFLEELLSQQGYQSLPELTPEQATAFGPYTLSYEELFDFTKSIEQSVEECAAHMAVISEKVVTPKDIMEQRAEIAAARDFIARQPDLWTKQVEKLQANKVELNLHQDVAALYEQLFAKYTTPVEQVKPVAQGMVDFLDSNLDFALFLNENADKVEFQGNMIIFNDEAAHQRANELLGAINDKAQELYIQQENLSRYMIINKR